MRIKVYGGTARGDGGSLCDSCRHSRIVRGESVDDELVVCEVSHMWPTRISFKVASCTHHDDRRFPAYYEMMQQAWIFQPGSRRKRPGFVRASELQERELLRHMASAHKAEE